MRMAQGTSCNVICVNEKVDFIVHSGDLFDTWGPSNRSLAELKDSLIRVREKNIPVFMVLGDHDRPKRVDYPAARIFDFLGLHLMGTEDLETHVLEDGTLIAGISNMKGSRREKLPDIYSRADSYARDHHNSVFISHQGVSGYSGCRIIYTFRAIVIPEHHEDGNILLPYPDE